MKRTIRRGVFETNSSSVHSLTICTQAEFEAWSNDELVFDNWSEEFIPKSELPEGRKIDNRFDYFDSPDAYFNAKNEDYETFKRSYVTPNGEKICAFGYYGHD